MDTLRNKKRAPTHPGALLREVVLSELVITQGEFTDRLGVSRRTVSEVLHERRAITPTFSNLRLHENHHPDMHALITSGHFTQ